jgi:hypothetical protein
MASNAAQDYQIVIDGDNSGFKKAVKGTLEDLNKLGGAGSSAANDLWDMTENLGGASVKTIALSGALAGITAGVAAFVAVNSKISEMIQLSAESKMGIEEFSKVYQTLGANVEMSEFAGQMSDFQEKIGEATQGSGSLNDQLKALGMSIQSINDLAPEQAFARYYFALKESGASTADLTFALEEAGSGLSKYIGTMSQYNSEAQFMADIGSKNATFTKEQSQQFLEMEKAGRSLSNSLLQLAAGPATAIANFLTGIANGVSTAVGAIDDLIDSVQRMRLELAGTVKQAQASVFSDARNATDVASVMAQQSAEIIKQTGYQTKEALIAEIERLKSDPAVQNALKNKSNPNAGIVGNNTNNYQASQYDPARAQAEQLQKLERQLEQHNAAMDALEAQRAQKIQDLQNQDSAKREKDALILRSDLQVHQDNSKQLLLDHQTASEKIRQLYANDASTMQQQLDLEKQLYQQKQEAEDESYKKTVDSANKKSQVKKAELTELQKYAKELEALGISGSNFDQAMKQKELEIQLQHNVKISNALNLKQQLIQENWAAVGGIGLSGLDQIKAQNKKESQEFEAHYKELEALGENTQAARAKLKQVQDQRVSDYMQSSISGDTKDLTRSIGTNAGDYSQAQISEIMQQQSDRVGITEVDPLEAIREQQAEELALTQELYNQKAISAEDYHSRVSAIEQAYAQQSTQIQAQTAMAQLQSFSSVAQSMSDSAGTIFGKTSRMARSMFVFNKALAIGQGIMDVMNWATKAGAQSGLSGALAAGQAIAAGMGIIANIKQIATPDIAQFHGGVSTVPNTGSYYLESGERVLDKNLNKDLKGYLANSNTTNNKSSVINAPLTINGSVGADDLPLLLDKHRESVTQAVSKAQRENR